MVNPLSTSLVNIIPADVVVAISARPPAVQLYMNVCLFLLCMHDIGII